MDSITNTTAPTGGDGIEVMIVVIEEDANGDWTIEETWHPKSQSLTGFDAAYFDSLHFDDWRDSHAVTVMGLPFDPSADNARDDAAYRLIALEMAA